MPSKPKIKLEDAPALREELDRLVDRTDQRMLCLWTVAVADHVLPYLDQEFPDCPEVRAGFAVQEQWRLGKARMHDVRQAGFPVHAVARQCQTPCARYAARAAGQAVSVGHMREHAMVCADYAVRAVGCDPEKGKADIIAERRFQLCALNDLRGAGD